MGNETLPWQFSSIVLVRAFFIFPSCNFDVEEFPAILLGLAVHDIQSCLDTNIHGKVSTLAAQIRLQPLYNQSVHRDVKKPPKDYTYAGAYGDKGESRIGKLKRILLCEHAQCCLGDLVCGDTQMRVFIGLSNRPYRSRAIFVISH